MYFYFLAPFFVWHRVELCRQHLIFFLVAKREEIFFSWVLSSLDCKLSCWKTTLSFLKTLFTTWLSFLWIDVSTFFWCRCQIFPSLFSFRLFWFCQRKTKLNFCFMEREKIREHICFLSLKLSCQVEWYH